MIRSGYGYSSIPAANLIELIPNALSDAEINYAKALLSKSSYSRKDIQDALMMLKPLVDDIDKVNGIFKQVISQDSEVYIIYGNVKVLKDENSFTQIYDFYNSSEKKYIFIDNILTENYTLESLWLNIYLVFKSFYTGVYTDVMCSVMSLYTISILDKGVYNTIKDKLPEDVAEAMELEMNDFLKYISLEDIDVFKNVFKLYTDIITTRDPA